MKIDIGLIVVFIAVSFFYIRLIALQRRRSKQTERKPETAPKKKKQGKDQPHPQPITVFSRNRQDWMIAGAGLICISLGLAIAAGWLPYTSIQPYWWIPTSLGIVAFSWGFK